MQIFKDIHIGQIIFERVQEYGIEISRICNFMNLTEKEVEHMYNCESLESSIILKWSKLLEYDFFRIYSQHLILYSPPSKIQVINSKSITNSKIPQFRKNIYTKEIIDFIIELIDSEEKTKKQIIEEYNIPKTTLYKWITKHKK